MFRNLRVHVGRQTDRMLQTCLAFPHLRKAWWILGPQLKQSLWQKRSRWDLQCRHFYQWGVWELNSIRSHHLRRGMQMCPRSWSFANSAVCASASEKEMDRKSVSVRCQQEIQTKHVRWSAPVFPCHPLFLLCLLFEQFLLGSTIFFSTEVTLLIHTLCRMEALLQTK